MPDPLQGKQVRHDGEYMDKKLLIVANWKANKVEAKDWLQQFTVHSSQFTGDSNKTEIAVAAPFTSLSTIANSLQTTNYKLQTNLASQDVSQFSDGAYTGEITAKMLCGIGVKYCLIGHSERRKYFKETNTQIEEKLKQAIESGITPILCAQTLDEIPENIRNFSGDKFIIMYEPFSAISVDGAYHGEDPQKVDLVLREWKSKLNLNCMFLYGGSVNSENVKSYVGLPLVSGFVVGHASLDPKVFFSIIKQCLTSQRST